MGVDCALGREPNTSRANGWCAERWAWPIDEQSGPAVTNRSPKPFGVPGMYLNFLAIWRPLASPSVSLRDRGVLAAGGGSTGVGGQRQEKFPGKHLAVGPALESSEILAPALCTGSASGFIRAHTEGARRRMLRTAHSIGLPAVERVSPWRRRARCCAAIAEPCELQEI